MNEKMVRAAKIDVALLIMGSHRDDFMILVSFSLADP